MSKAGFYELDHFQQWQRSLPKWCEDNIEQKAEPYYSLEELGDKLMANVRNNPANVLVVNGFLRELYLQSKNPSLKPYASELKAIAQKQGVSK